jgi:CheY-like chemotaxis protein
MSPESPSVRLDGVRVLVADDDEATRYVTRVTLQSEAAIVTVSETARHAFDILQQELLAHSSRSGPVLAHGGGTPAAALTGHVTVDDRARVLRAGFQFHVPKPVNPARLVGIVSILALKQ